MKEHGVIAIIKKHVLTAIGYMIPLVVAAGLCMALGQFIDGDVRNSTSGIGWYLYKAGGFGMSAVVPVITAGVAYSIADRPGIAPGLILGFICTEIKAGFIGGIVAGFLVGYLVLAVKKYVKLPSAMQGLMPVMVIPVLVTAVASVLMFTVVGQPFAWLQVTLTAAISGLQNGSKFVFGAVFPVGLMLVVLAGSELFTGNVMYMVMGVLDGKASVGGLCKNWVLSWVFNFVGALFVAYVLAYMSGIATDPVIAAGATKVAAAKVGLSWDVALIRGIGCNWLVCLAVYLALASDDIIGKIFGIWFPIMAFVTIGFEHSVANMFFIPLGMFLGADGVNWATALGNIIPVTIGNIIGAAIFVGCIYYITYLKDAS